MVYLYCGRFTVNNIFILSHCNHNSVNAWKCSSIVSCRFLFLKIRMHVSWFAVRRKCKISHQVQLPTYPPKNGTKFLPSRRRKSFWFVEKRRLCRGRFLRPPCFRGRSYLHWQNVRRQKLKMAGIKSFSVTSGTFWPIKIALIRKFWETNCWPSKSCGDSTWTGCERSVSENVRMREWVNEWTKRNISFKVSISSHYF